MRTALTTGPAVEPVTLEELKAQLRIDGNDEDAFLNICLLTARNWAEDYTNRKFITQTWSLYLGWFPYEIYVPFGQLQAVNSIQYYDTDNSLQTLSSASYEVDTTSLIGRIRPASGYSWPAVYDRYNPIIISFDCGYGDTRNDVPQTIRHGIQFVASQLFENRETINTLPDAAKAILFPHIIFSYGE